MYKSFNFQDPKLNVRIYNKYFMHVLFCGRVILIKNVLIL